MFSSMKPEARGPKENTNLRILITKRGFWNPSCPIGPGTGMQNAYDDVVFGDPYIARLSLSFGVQRFEGPFRLARHDYKATLQAVPALRGLGSLLECLFLTWTRHARQAETN